MWRNGKGVNECVRRGCEVGVCVGRGKGCEGLCGERACGNVRGVKF